MSVTGPLCHDDYYRHGMQLHDDDYRHRGQVHDGYYRHTTWDSLSRRHFVLCVPPTFGNTYSEVDDDTGKLTALAVERVIVGPT